MSIPVPPNRVKTSDLKSRFLANAQTSIFQVKLNPPAKVQQFLREKRGFNYSQEVSGGFDVELRCSEASLPGTSFATHEANNDFHGVREKIAYRRQYDDVLDLIFYVDDSYHVIELFEGWLDFISGIDTEQGQRSNPYLNINQSYRFNYLDDYRTNVQLVKFEKNTHPKETEKFSYMVYDYVSCFPITITQAPLTYQTSDVLRYNARMSYSRYVRNRYQENMDFGSEEDVVTRIVPRSS